MSSPITFSGFNNIDFNMILNGIMQQASLPMVVMQNRQTALRELLAECDTMVVVGGRNSNNTLQLVAAAEAAGRRVFHIERAAELRAEWFAESERVGLTAGTSTLKETVDEVHACLSEIAAAVCQPA